MDLAEERCKPYGECQGRIGGHPREARDIAACYAMKEELSELFRIRGGGGKGYALQEWKRWFDSAGAGGIPALANHARHGISTGKLEGFNNRIQVAKRIGYGYRDDDSFFTTIRCIPIPDLGSLSPRKREEPLFIEDISFGWRLYKYLSVPAGSSQCLPSR